MQPEVLSSAQSDVVRLLPPSLSDQGHIVSAQGTFHLFCHALGPEDMHFTWEKDGVLMEGCWKEEQHGLADGTVHILSWVRDIAAHDAEYLCTAKSKQGSKASKGFIKVAGGSGQGWSPELTQWKAAVSEHSSIMEGWKKTWESCNKKL
ncbi:hypothetical protein XELAEV_18010192mg [Xenopus laevis]|uniref:Ig-like domain-containing protein n=1 Tax=Xenopus laevis TaxID=8355 RepID=A0A974DTQ3_XENLA|nr:hypothetical protein XELAEV_18010192mg [Xenopus laevis]